MEKRQVLIVTGAISIILILIFIVFFTKNNNLFQNKTVEEKQSELIEAIQNYDVEKLNELLEKKVKIDFVSEEGLTPLQIALNYQSIDSAISLMEHGAELGKDDIPLIVQTILILNAYVQYQGSEDYEGEISSILSFIQMAYKRSPEDINISDDEGNTALHYAASRGIPEVVQLLLELGADPNIQNEYGNTPLIQSIENGQIEATEILLPITDEKGHIDKEGNSLLIIAAMNGNEELIKILINDDKDTVNHVNNEGKTALMYAAEYGYPEAVNVLVESGANVNLQSNEGRTALQYAVEWEHQEIIDLLQ